MTLFLDILRVFAACTSTVMILSPIPAVAKMHRTRDTGLARITPFVAMFANCHVWMMYAYLNERIFPLFATCVLGEVASLAYIAVFYKYATDRTQPHRLIAGFGLLITVTTVYAFLGGFGVTHQSRHDAGNTVGFVGFTTSFALYSSHFEHIGNVLKHRSAAFLPIQMIAAGITNNITWVVYCALSSDWFFFGPNVFTFTMSATQVALYFVFHPSTHPLVVGADEPLASVDKPQGPATPLYVQVQSPLVENPSINRKEASMASMV